MGTAFQRDQRRSPDAGRELPAEVVGNRAIAPPMHNQRRGAYALQLRSNIVAVDLLQQQRRGLRARGGALVTSELLLLSTARLAQEDVGQHA